eukprot:COSAG06_NODE_4645_length_4069_cov_9.897733_2_plen_61_part_00
MRNQRQRACEGVHSEAGDATLALADSIGAVYKPPVWRHHDVRCSAAKRVANLGRDDARPI